MKKYLSFLLFLTILTACTYPAADSSLPIPSVTETPIPGPTEDTVPEPVWTPPVYPEYTPPPVLEEPSYIPPGLVDLAVQAVETNTLNETFAPLKTCRSVSDEELLSIMDQEGQLEGVWDNLRYYVGGPSLFGELITIEADGDNDGVLDLIAITPGGSAGNIGLQFFQGQEGGSYQSTYDVVSFLGPGSYGFTTFEGKQYFWSTSTNYATKVVNGLSFYEFQNGVPVEEVHIYRKVSGYQEDLRQGEVSYTDKLAQMTFDLQESDGSYPQRAGTAERWVPDTNNYWGDLDNDGVEEFYFKNTWWPTTFWDVVRLDFRYEEGYTGQAEELLKIMGEHGYAVQTLWCDQGEQGNIIYIISRDAGEALSADVWQYQETQWVHLAQVLYVPEFEVKTRAHTQDMNIDFLDTKAFM